MRNPKYPQAQVLTTVDKYAPKVDDLQPNDDGFREEDEMLDEDEDDPEDFEDAEDSMTE